MGRWDRELVHLLPDSVKVFASAGAGFDWADIQVLGEKGEIPFVLFLSRLPALQLIISYFSHTCII